MHSNTLLCNTNSTHPIIDDCRKTKVVENLSAVSPHIDRTIFALALIIESIHLHKNSIYSQAQLISKKAIPTSDKPPKKPFPMNDKPPGNHPTPTNHQLINTLSQNYTGYL